MGYNPTMEYEPPFSGNEFAKARLLRRHGLKKQRTGPLKFTAVPLKIKNQACLIGPPPTMG